LKVELEEVWVPKDAGELEGLLLAIQNEPGKRILKHKIQQVIKEKAEIRKNWGDVWPDEPGPPWADDSESW
jgi:ABC-type cobalt transport system substrate-binding protein